MLKQIIIHGCDDCNLVTTEFADKPVTEDFPCPKCKKPLVIMDFDRHGFQNSEPITPKNMQAAKQAMTDEFNAKLNMALS